ncbi:uncharacterized protein LOC110702999 [Chenopodium quinoa]|uniref:uncharacterized protein LOC110702999 n=1 Tax=Chenopodium quinoa TaxID=63459 RepID=UPI000B784D75|nr:uncharacterized protein LOC110702999 [Chenopodium quinoa]
MEKFVYMQTKKTNDLEESIKQVQAHNKMLETQLTQLVIVIKSNNPSTSFPSQAIDPREHCNEIMTRFGTSIDETPPMMSLQKENKSEEVKEEKQCEVSSKSSEDEMVVMSESTTVSLTKNCNAIIKNHSPTKLKDHGSFSIPCSIKNITFENALCDLGASVSLMPLSVYEKLGIGGLVPTNVTLQLAD